MNLPQEIERRLSVLDPSQFRLIDDSAKHAGHSGNQGGSHFRLVVTSVHFQEKSMVMRHRMIYHLLADLIPKYVHALSIQALAPDET